MLRNQVQSLTYATSVLRKNASLFKTDTKPLTAAEVQKSLNEGFAGVTKQAPVQVLSLRDATPSSKH